jgi:hypothetical protein
MSSSSYAVPVMKVAARWVDLAGRAVEVHVFLHAGSEYGLRAETLAARLDHPEARFLPCEIEGQRQLLNLDAVTYLELGGTLPEVEEMRAVGASSCAVELDLASGETLRGELLYEAPAGAHRLSDLLNAPSGGFLLLTGDGLTRFVNRRAILRARG